LSVSEFNVTKPTVSDAVRVLLSKEFLEKDFSPTDSRRFNLILTENGLKLIEELRDYSNPLAKELNGFDEKELEVFFKLLSTLIFKLNQSGVIQVQRTCFSCKFYSGDKKNQHHCKLLGMNLQAQDIRLDCSDFEGRP